MRSPGPATTWATAGGPAPDGVGEGGGEVRLEGGVDVLDEDVEFAAAGQSYGEGVVVRVPEPGALRGAPVAEHLSAQFVDRALDAAAGDAADRVAVLVHRERRTYRQGCAAGDVDDGGQGEGACLAAPAVQCVRDVQHERVLRARDEGPPPLQKGASSRGGPGWVRQLGPGGPAAGRGRSALAAGPPGGGPGHSAQSNASAVMGSSRTRRPVALKTALAMAAATPDLDDLAESLHPERVCPRCPRRPGRSP